MSNRFLNNIKDGHIKLEKKMYKNLMHEDLT